jgi:hypothetical protein
MVYRYKRFRRKPRRRYKKKGRTVKSFINYNRIMRPMKPHIYLFKRTAVELLDLGAHPTASPKAGLNGVYPQSTNGTSNESWTIHARYTLDDLPSITDYTNLFTHYKIVAMDERFYLQNNPPPMPNIIDTAYPGQQVGVTGDGATETMYYGASFLQDSWFNPTALVTAGATGTQVYQIQRRIRRIMNVHGKKYYTKLKQLLNVNSPEDAEEVTVIARPKWIPTENTDVPHYGNTHWIRASTGTGTMAHVTVRIERTYYVACRGVR